MKTLTICLLLMMSTLLNASQQSKMLDKTKKALLAYPMIEKGTDRLFHQVKNKTIGKGFDEYLFILPILSTGKIEYDLQDSSTVYMNYRSPELGFKWKFRF